jgi:subtilisin family serine protease
MLKALKLKSSSVGRVGRCFVHPNRLLILLLLFGLFLANGNSSALPVQAAPALLPARVIPPGYSSEIIDVKFREGIKVSLRGEPLPQDLRNSMTSINRLFSAPEEQLDKIRETGVSRSAKQLPDLNQWFRITLKPGTDADKFIEALRQLKSVEIAEPAPLPAPPPAITPNFSGDQGYLNAAPEGIDARYAWTFPGGNGKGVKIYDIEYNWLQTHEDLSKANGVSLLLPLGASNDPPGYGGCPAPCHALNREHGTAVLGELIADRDAIGVTGISWGADIGLAPARTTFSPLVNVANAIILAVIDGSAGDVILIEQQTYVCNLPFDSGLGPVEWSDSVFDAIKMAVANGFVVVEAAGNGGVDLDQPACQGKFNRSVRNSGAIIVGAGGSPLSGQTRQRLSFSSYGSRLDLQGWGNNVMTAGYGFFYANQDNPNNPNFWYISTFGGTSSASPIVAGAVANLQGIALKQLGQPFTPAEIRKVLVQTGTPQLGNTAEHIGPLPNLRKAINQIFHATYLPVVFK